jgi:NAD(P)-dependent dehydrogenase (short-subunit alcohol dehydrogenase family)
MTLDATSLDLAGRNAVVVGASSGIGRELAGELTSMGAHVLSRARRAEQLDQAITDAAAGPPSPPRFGVDETPSHGGMR